MDVYFGDNHGVKMANLKCFQNGSLHVFGGVAPGLQCSAYGVGGLETMEFDNFEPLYLGGVLLWPFEKLWEYMYCRQISRCAWF